MQITSHIEKILEIYTQGDFYEEMKSALEEYIQATGKMDEDSNEYESRMNNFNDWYIFNYKRADGTRIIEKYIHDHNIDDAIAKAFYNANYSLFLFSKINFRKQIVLKDVLHSEKFVLGKDHMNLALVEDDLFVGRMINFEDKNYLLNGICILPNDVYSILKKESKKIRKLNNAEEEERFLLQIENLKTKSLHYGHVQAQKIFQFNPDF